MNKSRSRKSENIGKKECRKRLAISLAGVAFTIVMFAALRWTESDRYWYLLLFVPALLAVLGLLQVRERTCVALAARGLRNFDHGDERIADESELRSLQRRAVYIYLKSLVIAVVFTAIVYLTS